MGKKTKHLEIPIEPNIFKHRRIPLSNPNKANKTNKRIKTNVKPVPSPLFSNRPPPQRAPQNGEPLWTSRWVGRWGGVYGRVVSVLSWIGDGMDGKLRKAHAMDESSERVTDRAVRLEALDKFIKKRRKSKEEPKRRIQDVFEGFRQAKLANKQIKMTTTCFLQILLQNFSPSQEDFSDINFNGSMWSVISGPCTVDSSHCLLSPNYPEPYGDGQRCKAREFFPFFFF